MFKLLTVFLLAINFLQVALTASSGISLASEYQKNSGLQWAWALESLEKFSFNSPDKVLDVGCGDGKISALIAEQVPEGIVIGLDVSEKMIKQASSLFEQVNILFLQGSATEIPFKEQFDKVVSFSTLHWVLDQKQALLSMQASLKSGGMMLLILPGKAPNNLATLAEKIARSEEWLAYFPTFKQERVYYTVEEYKALLEEANLHIQSLKATESVIIYKDKEALVAWIKPLVNFIDHLPAELQTRFIEEIANQMMQNDPPLADGSIGIHQVKLEAIAIKTHR